MYHEEGIILYRQINGEKDMNHTIDRRVSSNGSILTGAFPFSFSFFPHFWTSIYTATAI